MNMDMILPPERAPCNRKIMLLPPSLPCSDFRLLHRFTTILSRFHPFPSWRQTRDSSLRSRVVSAWHDHPQLLHL